jgi:replicative superfamily II helicase
VNQLTTNGTLQPVRRVAPPPAPVDPTDMCGVSALVWEALAAGQRCLVFCGERRSAQTTAQALTALVCRAMQAPHSSSSNHVGATSREMFVVALQEACADDALVQMAASGAAYHHRGEPAAP